MLPSPQAVWRCVRLNWRVTRLALDRRWLGPSAYADGYDRVAPAYDEAWQRHLRPVTDALLARIPAGRGPGLVAMSESPSPHPSPPVAERVPAGHILDLGCGTGYTTARLAAEHPQSPVVGVDISRGMLAQAGRRVPGTRVEWVCADMIAFLRGQADGSAALVVSAWAIGYSQPARLIGEAARVLMPGGVLAFVVNLRDTLAPVFRAYRRCLAAFPGEVRLAARLHFPRDWPALERMLGRSGLVIAWHHDGLQPITPPVTANGSMLSWLLQTGVLAGFDAMLPLAEPGRVSAHFESLLRADPESLHHHYAAAVARRP